MCAEIFLDGVFGFHLELEALRRCKLRGCLRRLFGFRHESPIQRQIVLCLLFSALAQKDIFNVRDFAEFVALDVLFDDQ